MIHRKKACAACPTTRSANGKTAYSALFDAYGSGSNGGQLAGFLDDVTKTGKSALQALTKPVDEQLTKLERALTAILIFSAIAAVTGVWSVSKRR